MENNKKAQPHIRVFSTSSCPYCITLKAFLDEEGFKYEDIDVATNDKAREEMIEKSGQMGVPVIDIDKEFIVGFDREKIVKILGIKDK